jgi:hypothetical protein
VIVLLAILGFFIGLLVGLVLRDAIDLIRSRKEEPMPFSTPAHRVMTVGLILSIVSCAVVGALLVVTRKSANDYFTCVADWQQRFGRGYNARYEAAQQADAATDAAWDALDGVIEQIRPYNAAAFAKSIDDYRELRSEQRAQKAEQNHTQAENPPPPLPNKVCGNPQEVRR